MATTVCEISKNFPGKHAPEPSCKNIKILCPLYEKNSEYAPDIFKGLIYALFQVYTSNIFVFNQHSTQCKIAPLHQNFLDSLLALKAMSV